LLYEKCLAAGIQVVPLEFPPSGRLIHFVSALTRAIRANNVQIVHTNSNYDRTAGAFAAWRAGVPHVTNVHSLHSIQHNLTHRIRNRSMTDRFLADGVRMKELLVSHDGIPASKISVFYHGIDPDAMRRDEHQRRNLRNQFGFSEEHVVVGNIARMVPMKGHADLIQAFALVGKRYPSARLVIVGDGELFEELKARVRSLGIDGQTLFTGFREDLQALYSSFDIYAHSSVEGGGETISFAVQQALAHELPVVVTRVGDVIENVREGINGFVVPDRNAQALADKIMLLAGDPSLRHSMGKESRNYLLQRFTTEHMVSAVEEIYRNVLAARNNHLNI
jgi:glycosyltransferase involved in cell wall biosynthesis